MPGGLSAISAGRRRAYDLIGLVAVLTSAATGPMCIRRIRRQERRAGAVVGSGQAEAGGVFLRSVTDRGRGGGFEKWSADAAAGSGVGGRLRVDQIEQAGKAALQLGPAEPDLAAVA